MPLDEASRRFSYLLQGDLRRFAERRAEHEARGEQVKYDSVSRIASVETRRGDTTGRLYGEVLATYAPHDRILRWAWAGRASSTLPTHGEVMFREGQARGVPQLTMSVVGDLDEDDAAALVKLGALVARADGVHERHIAGDVEYVGLFERARPEDLEIARQRISVPPPAAPSSPASPSQPPRAYRSIPPVREVYEPRTGGSRPPPPGAWSNLDGPKPARQGSTPPAVRSPSVPPPAPVPAPARAPSEPPAKKPLREPSRERFLPVANAAIAALARVSKGYLQGLFVVTLDPEHGAEAGPRRLMVQLVVVDLAGILRALDPPTSLLEAAVAMVEGDRRDGNSSWRKLSARVTPKADGGATLQVDVT